MRVNFFAASSVDWVTVLCIANVDCLTTVTSYMSLHMINCEDLKVSNFENVIDLFFLLSFLLAVGTVVQFLLLLLLLLLFYSSRATLLT